MMFIITFAIVPEVEPHRLLKASQTSWLSLHSCVLRLIEQWDALTLYFQAVVATDNFLVSQKILMSIVKSHLEAVFPFPEFCATKVYGIKRNVLKFQNVNSLPISGTEHHV